MLRCCTDVLHISNTYYHHNRICLIVRIATKRSPVFTKPEKHMKSHELTQRSTTTTQHIMKKSQKIRKNSRATTQANQQLNKQHEHIQSSKQTHTTNKQFTTNRQAYTNTHTNKLTHTNNVARMQAREQTNCQTSNTHCAQHNTTQHTNTHKHITHDAIKHEALRTRHSYPVTIMLRCCCIDSLHISKTCCRRTRIFLMSHYHAVCNQTITRTTRNHKHISHKQSHNIAK